MSDGAPPRPMLQTGTLYAKMQQVKDQEAAAAAAGMAKPPAYDIEPDTGDPHSRSLLDRFVDWFGGHAPTPAQRRRRRWAAAAALPTAALLVVWAVRVWGRRDGSGSAGERMRLVYFSRTEPVVTVQAPVVPVVTYDPHMSPGAF